LGLEQDCSLEDIKSSFRNRVKKLHPDVSRDSGGVEKFRLLLAAYRILTDAHKREEYDRQLGPVKRKTVEFDYREFLKARTNDAQSQSRLVFFDLLHDQGEEALELYEKLLLHSQFSLELFLDREDFMDCAFMLAEEYERGGKYLKALGLLSRIVELERQKPYFRHFFEEVRSRIRTLAVLKLPRELGPRELLSRYFELAALGLSDGETAFYTKKIAELYLELGRADLAGEYLERGLRLSPRLSGAGKLKERIGCGQISVG
jgi:tetratricopeptide (TPR) repeat protein